MKFRNQKLRYSVPEFCELTGLSRSKAYERIRLGQITVVKDGKETFVTHDEALRYAGTSLPAAYPPRSAVAA